jgi:methylmalonyl-CoA/ethylmalonyl-CoA epimerase
MNRIAQMAFVVADLEAAIERYSRVLGPSNWRCYTFAAANHAEAEYHGSPTDFSARLALNDQSPQLELIQPLGGESIHQDWLSEHGEGIHHVGVVVDSLEHEIGEMEDAGYPVIQSGSGFGVGGDGAYAYFDTADELGVIVEAFEPPESLPEPDFVWPSPS